MGLQRAGHDLMTEQTKINSGSAVVKNLPANASDMGLIPGLGQSPGEGNDGPLQFSCLGNPHGQRSLAVYSPWGHKELDITEHMHTKLTDSTHILSVSMCQTPRYARHHSEQRRPGLGGRPFPAPPPTPAYTVSTHLEARNSVSPSVKSLLIIRSPGTTVHR